MSICERPTIPVVMVNCFRIGTRKKLINYCKCLITFKYRDIFRRMFRLGK